MLWILQALILTTVVINNCNTSQKNVCDTGWFGSSCQYLCHCVSKRCDQNGTCAAGDRCKKGWFGPACQFEDLVPRGTVTTNQGTIIPEITDGDSSTCLPHNFLLSVSVTWPSPYPITWLRVYVEDKSLLHEISMQFSNGSNSPPISCPYPPRNFTVSENMLDIQCELGVPVQQVTLTGEGVTSLCYLHISGGRNVALRQNTSQSSDFTKHFVSSVSDNAVDGNTNGNWKEGSCTHTDYSDDQPSWTLQLSQPAIVNRLVVYNRLDTNNSKVPNYYKDRLRGFTLKTYNKYNTEVFSYTDTQNTTQDVYTMIPMKPTQATSKIRIQKPKLSSRVPNILSLCEVEVYGNLQCEPGYFGLECKHKCNCAVKNETCFISTGGCLSGCAPGFNGEGCAQTCGFQKYGRSCNFSCSEFCNAKPQSNESTCHHVDGSCFNGCKKGYNKPLCSSPCTDLTFGEDCKQRCSQGCARNGNCHHITGACSYGCKDGYIGATCTEKCTEDTFGKNCNSTCSEFCIKDDNDLRVSSCHHVNGNCLYGCKKGYEGLQCNMVSRQKDSPVLSFEIIVSIATGGFVFVAVTIALIYIVLRKHRKIRQLRTNEQYCPDYDNAPRLKSDYEAVYSEVDDDVLRKNISFIASSLKKCSTSEDDDEDVQYEGTEEDHYDSVKPDMMMHFKEDSVSY